MGGGLPHPKLAEVGGQQDQAAGVTVDRFDQSLDFRGRVAGVSLVGTQAGLGHNLLDQFDGFRAGQAAENHPLSGRFKGGGQRFPAGE